MKFKYYSPIVLASLTALLVTPIWNATTKPVSINDVVSKPEVHIGKVDVVGQVAAVSPHKGFILIDNVDCAACTTECLTEKSSKKLPVLWAGVAPVLKNIVRVQGTLSKTAKGFIFNADKVTKQ